jgi:type IX secretion system PorP/SprF family membrane protein
MKKPPYIVLILWLCLMGKTMPLTAQDLVFSQYSDNSFLTNSALLARHQKGQIMMQYRNQPLSSGESWSSMMLYGDIALANKNQARPWGGFGVMFLREDAGNLLTTQGLALSSNYQIHSKRQSLRLGWQLGWFQQRFQTENITTDNQFLGGFFNPEATLNENFDNTSNNYLTLRAGIHWAYRDLLGYERVSIGLGWNNFNRPTMNVLSVNPSHLPDHLATHVSLLFFNPLVFSIEPNLLWIRRLQTNYFMAGSWFRYALDKTPFSHKSMAFGLWYQSNGAAIMALNLEQPRYTLGLSYDLPIQDASDAWLGSGAIELRLGIKFRPHYPQKVLLDSQEPIRDSIVYLESKKTLLLLEDIQLAEGLPYLAEFIERQKASSLSQNSLNPIKEGVILKKLPSKVQALNTKSVRFAFKQDTLSLYYQSYLDKVVEVLNEYPTLNVVVSGHTCNIGTDTDNLILSKDRANYIKQDLIGRGISTERIIVMGLGSAYPIVPNTSEQNRQINRRVEFEFIFID